MGKLDPRLENIFAQALGIADANERAAFVERACGGDETLRREVEELLQADQGAGDFMKATQAVGPANLIPSEQAGDRIGRYKLLEQIGEGGFGVVWMAEQEEPVRRRVALKIIKLGMDTKEVVARFEAERQALAMMDHPNIAIVFDGGATDTGRPFFVMELVKGIPITKFCDERKLSTQERLELFKQVCHAVQHAHQKGVIHRDLKPSNILVTVKDDRPVPKVIDFGIAKATQARLTEKTVFTRFQQWIGTPAYMSPEQAGLGSLDVDTRSDIYSLGVLLYELLTGRTPFDPQKLLAAGYDAVMRTIREEEPPKPSTRLTTLAEAELSAVAAKRGVEPAKLGRSVRGDLDWIVMKSLEKDRQRRYETAASLARDVERHLRAEPVSAAAPGLFYRAGKFVRRNRPRLAFATLALVAVALAVAGAKLALSYQVSRRAVMELGTNTVSSLVSSDDALRLGRLLDKNPGLIEQRSSDDGSTPLASAASAGSTNALRLLLARGAVVDATNGFGWTALMAAAARGRVATVATLLEAGANPNHAANDGQTALFLAASSGATNVGRLLLTKGAAVDRPSLPSQITPLEIAAILGYPDFVELLRAHGARPPSGTNAVFSLVRSDDTPTLRRVLDANPGLVNERDADGATPLFTAASAGSTNTLRLLLARGATVDATNRLGFTPLLAALATGHVSVVPALLEAGANPNLSASQGETALNLAVVSGATEAGRLLLAKGAQVDAVYLESKITALHLAAMWGDADFVDLLLAHGAHTDLKSVVGFTPLHFAACAQTPERLVKTWNEVAGEVVAAGSGSAIAAQTVSNQLAQALGKMPLRVVGRGHRQIAESLLARKADLEATNDAGSTPLLVAALFTNRPVAEVLVAHKANLNTRGLKGLSPLAAAALKGDEAIVSLLVEAGADPDLADSAGFTPLHTAVEYGHGVVVKALLAHKANPNLACPGGQTPLHTAAGRGDTESMRLLLDQGAALHALAPSGTPLARAVMQRQREAVDFLLQRGAKPDVASARSGVTALHWAALLGYPEIAQRLLEAGATVEAASTSWGTPLSTAAAGRHGAQKWLATAHAQEPPDLIHVHSSPGSDEEYVAVLRTLLAAKANVNAREPSFDRTPLFLAVNQGHSGAVEVFLGAGADLQAVDRRGLTALHAASEMAGPAEGAMTNIVTRLLRAGAALEATDKAGGTPLHAAANAGKPAMVALLLAAGARINAVGPNRCTPLQLAVIGGHRDVVELLLDKGANTELPNAMGTMALLQATLLQAQNMVALLLEHGADVNAGDADGSTALMASAGAGELGMIKLLLEHGAKVNAANQSGWTAFLVAAQAGHVEAGRLLLERGAKFEVSNKYQVTPLMIAANTGRSEMVKFLLERGAPIAAKDNRGMTALDWTRGSDDPRLHPSVAAGRKECAELLRKAASDLKATPSVKETKP